MTHSSPRAPSSGTSNFQAVASISVPGAPYVPARSGWDARGASVPEVGELDAESLDGPRSLPRSGSVEPSIPGPDEQGQGASHGLRVVEFGTGLAAPWIGRMLAWAGADVIKIESHAFPDVPRLFVSPKEPELGTQPECSPWFTDWSAGKRFVALDLRNAEGAELACRIVDECDVVIANYSSGVLEKLGLGYEVFASRPNRETELVMLESSGFGGSGPIAHYVTWGPNIEALSGLCHLLGLSRERVHDLAFRVPRSTLGSARNWWRCWRACSSAIAAAGGQVIHLSQFETTVASIGRVMVQFAATGEEPPRRGNREAGLAPYGCFPCKGTTVGSCSASRRSGLAGSSRGDGSTRVGSDERYATMAGRLEHQDEIESRSRDGPATR